MSHTTAMTTTPMIIGKIPINTDKYHKQLLKNATYGETDIAELTVDDPVLVSLRQICVLNGLTINTGWEDRRYGLHDYCFGAGSIFTHDDPGMGLTAGVLVAVADLSKSFFDGDRCTLFAEGQHIDIPPGGVFLFDADKDHAWMANCRWLIAMQSVLPPTPP